MDARAIYDAVVARLGDAVSDFTVEGTKDPFFRARADRLRDVAFLLRDDDALAFDFLQNLTAVDWIKQDRLELVYHLWSYARRHGCVVKVELPRAQAEAPSLADVWRAAEWYEREQFDLFGVTFRGHPDLRRILLPEDWLGHPMRKDYVEAPAYHGMPTTRPSTLELLPLWDKAGERKP